MVEGRAKMPMTVDTVEGRTSGEAASGTGAARRDDRPLDASATVRLITQERNPFSEKVARALALKKVEFERVIVTEPHEIALYSPETRELPVLEIDGERRPESSAILFWLDERYPEPPLLSSDTKVAEAQQRLAAWSDSSFAWYWNRWRASQEPAEGGTVAPTDSSFFERMRSTLRLGARASRADTLELQVIAGIERRLDDLVGLLGDREFFHADRPSMADLAVFGMLLLIMHGPIPGSREMLEARPSLVAYLHRLESATGGPYVAAA